MMNRILIVLAAFLILTSCNKDEEGSGSTYIRAARDLALVQNRAVKIFPLAYYSSKQYSWIDSTRYSCASLSVISGDTATWPASGDSLVLQLDYGTGCTDPDFSTKEGILEFLYIGHPDSTQSTIEVSFSGFRLDNWSYEGLMKFENSGGVGQYTMVSDSGMWYLGSDIVSVNFTGDVLLADTSNSVSDWTGHIWEWNYSGNGTDINERNFEVAAYLPLIYEPNCLWVNQGTTDLRPDEYSWRSLRYGNGLCDEKATLAVGNSVYTFNIQ